MSKFKTPNGKAEVNVPDSQDEEMIARGMKLVQPKDSTASKKPKKSEIEKPVSEAKEGDTRTR